MGCQVSIANQFSCLWTLRSVQGCWVLGKKAFSTLGNEEQFHSNIYKLSYLHRYDRTASVDADQDARMTSRCVTPPHRGLGYLLFSTCPWLSGKAMVTLRRRCHSGPIAFPSLHTVANGTIEGFWLSNSCILIGSCATARDSRSLPEAAAPLKCMG